MNSRRYYLSREGGRGKEGLVMGCGDGSSTSASAASVSVAAAGSNDEGEGSGRRRGVCCNCGARRR